MSIGFLDILKECKFSRPMNAVAAGTSDQNSSVIDMLGFDSIVFVSLFGALTSTQVTQIKVQQGNQSNLSDAADLAGSNLGPLADTDGNKMLISQVFRPSKRYVRLVVDRGTANAVIDGVIAIQGNARNVPVTQSSQVAFSETLNAPAEGTA